MTTDYEKRPDWREGRQDIEAEILAGFLRDRSSGARVQLEYGGQWVNPNDYTKWELEDAARKKAVQAIERAMRDHGDVSDAGRMATSAPEPAVRVRGVGNRDAWAA